MTASVIATDERLRDARCAVELQTAMDRRYLSKSTLELLLSLIDAELSRRAVSEEVGDDIAPSRWAQEADKDSTHSDDHAVERFAMAMREKLARKRADGRGGWEHCSQPQLAQMLVSHIEKGDPVDIANFAMMIYHNELRAPVLDGGAVALRAALMPPLSTEQREAVEAGARFIEHVTSSTEPESANQRSAIEADRRHALALRALLTTPSRPAVEAVAKAIEAAWGPKPEEQATNHSERQEVWGYDG